MRAALAAALVALPLSAATAAERPLILLPPALGRPDRVFVSGRVVGERHDYGEPPMRNVRRLAAWNLAGAQVEVMFRGRIARTTSGHDGEFAVEIAPAEGETFPPGPHPVHAKVPGGTASSTVHVVPADAPFLVVSDLDDTLAVTNVASKRRLLAATFLQDEETQPAVPGMAAFLRCLREGKASAPPVAIVSGSPVQFAGRVERFLAKNGFPPSALFLRNLGLGTLSGYKEPVLAALRARFPQPLVLVGDSGEHDPEIYRELARAAPERVLRVYVRAAASARGPSPPERFEGMLLFSDPADAARDAASRGLADAECVAREFPAEPPR